MNIEELRQYCLSKKAATESFPFDDKTLVFKVMNKIFAITPLEKADCTISLKCNPERAIELRESYTAIKPGYHLSKAHWNTLTMDGSIEGSLTRELIDHSYDLIVSSLKKADKVILAQL